MTRKRLWMNRISGIVCLLLWIALVIFLSGTTGKIAGMALGIMLLVAVIYNLYLPKEVSTHLIIPAYAQKEEKITGRLCISNTGVFPVLSGKVFLQVKKTISGEQEIFSMNIRAAGRKNGAAAFVIDSEYMGFLEITILRVELYSFFGCMKKVTYVNQEKVVMILPQTTELHFPVQNSGVACSFFDEEQSGKKGNGPGEYEVRLHRPAGALLAEHPHQRQLRLDCRRLRHGWNVVQKRARNAHKPPRRGHPRHCGDGADMARSGRAANQHLQCERRLRLHRRICSGHGALGKAHRRTQHYDHRLHPPRHRRARPDNRGGGGTAADMVA